MALQSMRIIQEGVALDPENFEEGEIILDFINKSVVSKNDVGEMVEFLPTSLRHKTTKTTESTGELPNWALWIADTTSGPVTRQMPSSPDDGEEVTVYDSSKTASTNNITVTSSSPTTILEPIIDSNGGSKKWRYDSKSDSWDLVFSQAPSSGGGSGNGLTEFNIINGGAEEGNNVGWTITNGQILRRNSPTPHEGSWIFYGGTATLSQAYQEFDLNTIADQQYIDDGNVVLKASGWQSSYSSSDDGYISLRIYDESYTQLLRLDSPFSAPSSWTYRELMTIAPAGSKYVRIFMRMEKDAGSNNDAYFDDLRLAYGLL